MILFTGGGSASVHAGISPPGADLQWDQTPLLDQAPPLDQAPREQTLPRPGTLQVQSMLGDTVNARGLRILLECNLVSKAVPSALLMKLELVMNDKKVTIYCHE